jgi:hypothetical protein
MKRSELEALDKADLVALAERQAERIAELEARLSGVDGRLEELERRTMRGAAPFAREDAKRARSPKRPGRKGGHDGAFRIRPDDDDVGRWIDVPLERCPGCGAALDPASDEVFDQTIIDAPPAAPSMPRPRHRRSSA